VEGNGLLMYTACYFSVATPKMSSLLGFTS